MEKLTRQQAAQKGLHRYYTGKPCRNGHDAERYTSTGSCVVCSRENVNAYHKRIAEAVKTARETAAGAA